MPGRSRSNNGVASPTCVPGIHVLDLSESEDVDGQNKSGHDGFTENRAGFCKRGMNPVKNKVWDSRLSLIHASLSDA